MVGLAHRVAPVVVHELFAGHTVHLVMPVVFAYVPAGQALLGM